jgi:hypothetical protein
VLLPRPAALPYQTVTDDQEMGLSISLRRDS